MEVEWKWSGSGVGYKWSRMSAVVCGGGRRGHVVACTCCAITPIPFCGNVALPTVWREESEGGEREMCEGGVREV